MCDHKSSANPLEADAAQTPLRVLVTGASGFLGRRVVRQLAERGHSVTATSRSRVRCDTPGVVHKACDLLDSYRYAELVDGQDVVIHSAAMAHRFGADQPDSKAYHHLNAEVTQGLSSAASQAGVRRFVLVSSVSVYGPDQSHRDEQSPLRPEGPYAVSKLNAERLAEKALRNSGTDLTVLRLATLYGPGDPGNVGRLLSSIASGRFRWIGRGSNRKSLLHVEDAATACVVAAEEVALQTQEPYNVVGHTPTMREVVTLGATAMGRRAPRWHTPAPIALGIAASLVGATFGWPKARRLQTTLRKWLRNDSYCGRRFQERFGFVPKVALERGLAEQARDHTQPPATSRADAAKRAFDLIAAATLLFITAIPMAVIALAVRLTSKGPAIYTSARMGRRNEVFRMPKFRSMRTDTPQLATHLLTDADQWITPIGGFLRKSSLDELPQLWSILRGDMSFVGPRPALFNQEDLIRLRSDSGVDALTPGLTGWAQVNGRDELSIEQKVALDHEYLQRRTLAFDLRILCLTFLKVVRSEGVQQRPTPHTIDDARRAA